VYGILGIIGLILILFGIIFWIKYNKSQKIKKSQESQEFENLLSDKLIIINKYMMNNNYFDININDEKKINSIYRLLFNIYQHYKKNVQYNNNHQIYMRHLIDTIKNLKIDEKIDDEKIDELINIESELKQLFENYIT